MARQGRRRARPHGEHAPEAPGERMAAFREHVAWWKLATFVFFMLWLGAVTWADSHGRDGASSWLMMLVGVVVVALSSVLWVRTHPKRPGPGYSRERVRGYLYLTCGLVGFGTLVIILLAVAFHLV